MKQKNQENKHTDVHWFTSVPVLIGDYEVNFKKKAICSFSAPAILPLQLHVNTQHRGAPMIRCIRLTYGVHLPIKIIFGPDGLFLIE